MGEIIARKVRGMNWKAKISLVLIFTLVFSTFMYQGFYKPRPAYAMVPSRVQFATASVNAGTSIAMNALGSAPVDGNTMIAVISTRSASADAVTGITQTGATWTRVASTTGTAGTTTEIWYAPNVSGAGTNITIGLNASLRAAAVVAEYSGLLTPTSLDVPAATTGNSNSASTGTTGTTAQNDELWIGGVGLVNSGYTLGTITNSFASFANVASTSGTASNNARVYALEKIVTATAIAYSGGTVSTSSQWSGAIATFKASPAVLATYYADDRIATNVGVDGTTDMTTIADQTVTGGGSNENRVMMDTTAPTGTTRARVAEGGTDTRTGQEFFRSYTPAYTNATIISAGATAYADFTMRTTGGNSCSAKATLYEYNDTTGIVGTANGTTAGTACNINSTSRQTMNNVSFGNAEFTVAAGNRLMVVWQMDMNNTRPAFLWGQSSSNTPSGYQSITVAETPVPNDQVNVADGTNPSSVTVYANDTNKAIDGFTMAATNDQDGQAAVTGVSATVTNSGDISGIRFYKDNGTVGTYEPGTDTLLSTGTPGASVSFSGFTENLTTSATNYLIVADIASGATVGHTVTAVVSGLTVTAPDTAGTLTDSSATLTIGNPVCVRTNPTVAITPLTAAVSAGSAASYTVSVANNDNQFCSPTTFTISPTDIPVVPNADFSASTLGAISTGSLAYGQTWTTSLTHLAASGASLGQTLQTYVTSAADANHAAVQSNTVTSTVVRNTLLHNSQNMTANGSPKNYWNAQGGWGIAGGVYGEFTCQTCHTKTTTNIKRIKTTITVPDTSKGNIPGIGVNLQSTSGTTNGFGDDQNTHATSTRICEVCHSQVAKHKYNQAATPLHENTATIPANYQDCIVCHEHKKGFALPGCIDCHAKQQGNRVAVVGQFSANSHHVQGKTLTDTDCYQCHWEADANGSINYTYHLGWQNGLAATSGSAVDLVVWTGATRPTTADATTRVTFRENQGRTDMANINTHCLGCHSEAMKNGNVQPFGDGKTPNYYAWDGNSIAARYSQIGTTTWGKYTATTNAAQKNVTKAFSAHGNAANNERGWDTTNGVDGAITNTSGNVNVLCFDCHNSHGSSVSGTTTSYTSATTNSGIMKDTTANLGAYTMTYKPQASDGTGSRVTCNAGASLCFDCHMTQNAGTTPWGWGSTAGGGTFNATQAIIGYTEKPGWKGAANTNPAGPQQRYAYKNKIGSAGGHFGASSGLNTTPMGTINGLCTPCHDPHGVSPTDVGTCSNTSYFTKASCQGAGGTWTANATTQAYGVPLLKGTWMTSPYKEDAAQQPTNQQRGGGRNVNPFNAASFPGYHIDQNTFDDAITQTGQYDPPETWNFSLTTKIAQTDTQFGGLCLSCHNKADINPDAGGNRNNTWKSYDRIHNTVKGWGGSGANVNNTVHAFPCSKCHTPHNSCLPRLMITNCLDYKHNGQFGQGGTAKTSGATARGDRGHGWGRYPGGGGGYGSSRADLNSMQSRADTYFFGIAPTSKNDTNVNFRQCHDAATGNSGAWPDFEYWNSKTPWTAP